MCYDYYERFGRSEWLFLELSELINTLQIHKLNIYFIIYLTLLYNDGVFIHYY